MRKTLPSSISRESVLEAIAKFNKGVEHGFADSTKYDLVHEGRSYPPKAILGLALEISNGDQWGPEDFSGGINSKCVRLLELAGFSVESKLSAIRDKYDDLLEVPSASDYARAFKQLEDQILPIQLELLNVQYCALARQVSARFLAHSISEEISTVNLRYGALAKLICEFLDIEPRYRPNGTPAWWTGIAHGWDEPGGFIWQMRDEVARALEELGWVEIDADSIQSKPLDGEEPVKLRHYREGKAKQIYVNTYERDRGARKKCIEHYSCKCQVCGFEFSDFYGDMGEGFIHVHHRTPLASIGETYKVDPVKDLIPVCPNCHAMLHKGSSPPTVEELKQRINA